VRIGLLMDHLERKLEQSRFVSRKYIIKIEVITKKANIKG
jgi:hypothetical protein